MIANRDKFEENYKKVGGCMLPEVKERHWNTWLAAQVALLEEHGTALGGISSPFPPRRMSLTEPE